jgi:hypothetical protein
VTDQETEADFVVVVAPRYETGRRVLSYSIDGTEFIVYGRGVLPSLP